MKRCAQINLIVDLKSFTSYLDYEIASSSRVNMLSASPPLMDFFIMSE